MKTLTTGCWFLMITGLLWAGGTEKQLGDFSLYDQRGIYHQMSQYNNRRGIVLLITSSQCP